MLVALDAMPLTVSTGGIRRYTEQLGQALAREYPEDQFYAVADRAFPCPVGMTPGRLPSSKWSRRWWSFGLPSELKRLDAAVFHGTDFAVPFRRVVPSVMTIHDLSPWKKEPWRASSNQVRRRTPWLLRLGRVDHIITPTEAIRREVLSHLGQRSQPVTAVPLAAAPEFTPQKPKVGTRPYLLALGTVEPRKNLTALIEVWKTVWPGGDVGLWIAGRLRSASDAALRDPAVRWLGPVDDAALPGLYSGALAFVFPSHYEGFGLPLLEAMQCGAPAVTSTDPALVEVGGGAAVAAPMSEWPAILRRMAHDSEWRLDLRARGLERARDFSWARTARLTYAVYREVVSRHG